MSHSMKLWIVKHAADTDETRPAVYFSKTEADAHAAQFLPGVARVVELDDAALIRAQAEAETSEHLSMIADELIAGLGEPGRGLAEMIREGIPLLESYAASVVWNVRRKALEDAALVCEAQEYQYWLSTDYQDFTPQDCADAVRALKDKP